MGDIDSSGWSALFVILVFVLFVVVAFLVFACICDTLRRKGIFNLGKRAKKRRLPDDFDRNPYSNPSGPTLTENPDDA
jgi:hypothetical protein